MIETNNQINIATRKKRNKHKNIKKQIKKYNNIHGIINKTCSTW